MADIEIVNLPGDDNDGAGAADVGGDLSATREARISARDVGMALTGIGNAERFVEKFEGQMLHVKAWGYLAWDGKRWLIDRVGLPTELAKTIAVDIFSEAAPGDAGSEQRRWAVRTATSGGLTEMLTLASSDPRMARTPNDFDQRKYVLNVDNGLLDLRTGELREHRQSDMCSKITPAAYIPGAKSQLWDAFLRRALPNEEVRRYAQRIAGSSLVGDPIAHKFYLVQGRGRTGKSTFLGAIKEALGDYAGAIDPDTLLNKIGDPGIKNDIARLAGLRLVIGVEPQAGKRWNMNLIKALTGGDIVTARFLYHENFEFRPQFVLWIGANAAPSADAIDDAFWARIRKIPFDTFIPEAERDVYLSERLKEPARLSAILSWAVEGCQEWLRNPMAPEPQAVTLATTEYREENDPLTDWLNDRCDVGTDYIEDPGKLWQCYVNWLADANNLRGGIKAGKNWTQALANRGFKPVRRGGRNRVTGWQGVRIRTMQSRVSEAVADKATRN